MCLKARFFRFPTARLPVMDEESIRRIRPDQIRSDDAASELLNSPNMRPYMQLAISGLQGSDITAELQAIAELPLQDRYVWRVASALKWAFADFDTVNVRADRDTLSESDLYNVIKLLELRPLQFCLFLKALVGPLEMQRMMDHALKTVKDLGDV